MQTIIHKYLGLEEDKISRKELIVLCILGYLFGFICRSFYIFNAAENSPHVFLNGVPMINTEDGYFFAEFIKNLIIGHPDASYKIFLKDSGHGSLLLLTWLLYQLSPFDIEQVAVFIPLIFAPLVVIPFVFIGRLLGNTFFGFGAGLICSVGNAFLRRSSFAYYDTDLFTLTVPALMVLAGIYAIMHPSLRSVFLVGMVLLFSSWLDKGIIVEIIYMTFMAVFIIMHFRNTEIFKMLIMLSAPLVNGPEWYELVILCSVIFALLRFSQSHPISFLQESTEKKLWIFLSLSFFLWVIWNLDLLGSIRGYIRSFGGGGRGVLSAKSTSWSFYKVTGTIVEARKINFDELAESTSGSMFLFLLSIFGAFLALIRFPLLIIGGALFGIGFFALTGGVRFSLYLTPITSIGAAYLIMLIKKYINANLVFITTPFDRVTNFTVTRIKSAFSQQKRFLLRVEKILSRINRYNPLRVRYLDWGVALLLLAVVLSPGVTQAYNQQARAVARLEQIDVLKKLSTRTSFDDYIISWWDYGYVMRYYSNMRTLIDGGKHGNDNYIVSKAFADSSQALAANLLREAVESYAANDREYLATQTLFGYRRSDFQPNLLINEMRRPNYVLKEPPSRDIYLYIPYQMLRIYGVVRYFSDLNLVTGELTPPPFMYTQSHNIDRENNKIFMPGNIAVDLQKGIILRDDKAFGKINTFYQHIITAENESQIRQHKMNALGTYSVLLSNDYRTLYVGTSAIMNSNFIQMFFFRNYDKNYFELVDANPFLVVYKIKKRESLNGSPSLTE